MTTPDIQAVLFDLDGTLISSDEMSIRMLDILGKKYRGEGFTQEQIRDFRGMPTREILAQIHPDNVESLLEECVKLENEYRSLSYLFPGVLETLSSLKEKGVRMGVITAQAAPEMEAVRKHFPLDDFIKIWVSADDVLHPKPDPEPIHKALEVLGVPPAHTLVVGDSHYDIEAGKRAGVVTGAAVWGRVGDRELLSLQPDHVFSHPNQIPALCVP